MTVEEVVGHCGEFRLVCIACGAEWIVKSIKPHLDLLLLDSGDGTCCCKAADEEMRTKNDT